MESRLHFSCNAVHKAWPWILALLLCSSAVGSESRAGFNSESMKCGMEEQLN